MTARDEHGGDKGHGVLVGGRESECGTDLQCGGGSVSAGEGGQGVSGGAGMDHVSRKLQSVALHGGPGASSPGGAKHEVVLT